MRCTTTTTATTARHIAPGRNRGVQGFQPNLMALSIAAAFLTACPWARAQPSGAQVVAGQASFHQQGGSLVVNTVNAPGAQHSTINWQSFNVPTGTSTWFNQPSAASTSINRVTAPNPSSIVGNLGSNGHLVLVNPAGIAVGSDAVVDTARFTAAAMQMTDADAMGGRLRFDGGAEVSVLGRVLARTGDVVLLAPELKVQPQALIQADNGAVMLAAGQKIELVSPGLEGLVFEVQAPTNAAVNLGTLQGNAVGMFARTLRHSGQVDVQAVTDEGGKVLLVASKLTLDANSSIVKSGAGDLMLIADDLVIDGSVTETGGRAILRASTLSRPITIGSSIPDPDHLNLSDSLLDNISSRNLEIGSRASTGGIHVVGAVTRPSPSTSSLSLLQGETGGVSQTSTGQIVVNSLLAEGGFVNLMDSPNDVAVIAGKASNGFNFQSAHTPGFQVGVVNGVSGIEVGTDTARADLLLKSSGGDSAHITQGSGADLRAGKGEFISTGNVELMNDSNELSILKGNTGGSYRVTSHQAIGLDTISTGSSASGSSVANAAIGIRALSITGMVAPTSTHPAPAMSATHGSVSLNATAGNIGSTSTPLRLGHVALTVNAHAAGSGSSIDIIATHPGRTATGDISAEGNIELEGPGGTSTLEATRSMTSTDGHLLINNFLTTKLGRTSSDVITARAIEVRSTLDPSSIEVRGTLRPGGQGRIGSRASVLQSTNVNFLAGSVLEFDMSDDAARDRINIMGAGTFNAASTIKMNLTGVNKDPVAADYTLISGAVTGTGGKSTVFPVFDRGNLASSRAATLKYSSLVLSISNATPPPPDLTGADVLRELLAIYVLGPGPQTGQRLPLFSNLAGESGSSSLGNVVYDDGRICR